MGRAPQNTRGIRLCFALRVDRLRQRWLSFSSQLSAQEVETLLNEVGVNTSIQQKQQQQRLLLVQYADEALALHVETEVPGLLLAVFLLARADPAVLEVREVLVARGPLAGCESVDHALCMAIPCAG